MKRLVMVLAAACLVLGSGPASAQEVPIAGNWETGPRDYRYTFELCGPRGQDLCGTMTYGLDQSPRIQRYVGKRAFDQVKRVGPQSWKGNIFFSGYSMNGTITMVGPDKIEIDGCVVLIICGEFAMYREDSTVAR